MMVDKKDEDITVTKTRTGADAESAGVNTKEEVKVSRDEAKGLEKGAEIDAARAADQASQDKDVNKIKCPDCSRLFESQKEYNQHVHPGHDFDTKP
jgi:hypothetical protein